MQTENWKKLCSVHQVTLLFETLNYLNSNCKFVYFKNLKLGHTQFVWHIKIIFLNFFL